MNPPYQLNQYSGYQPQNQGQVPNPYAQQPPNQYGQPSYGPYPNQYSQPPNQGSQPPYGQQRPPYQQQSSGYGQQPPPYGQQPPPYGQQPQYGNPNQTDIPDFKLISRGNGVDEREFSVITHASADALNRKEDPLSNGVVKRIKKDLGGEWMVFACIEELKGYDFSIGTIQNNGFLSFTIQKFRFQVCRLRD